MTFSNYTDLPWDRRSLYPSVDVYSNLPSDAVVGAISVVTTDSGTWPFKKIAGFYIYTASGWKFLGDFNPEQIKEAYESNANTNAFTDYYKAAVDNFVAGTSATASAVVSQFTCGSSTLVKDLVVADITTDNQILTVQSNVYSNLIFGAVINKPTPTTCDVLLIGAYDGFTGLSVGKAVYASITGKPTTVVPTTGHQQVLGIAISSTKVAFNFSTSKVILAS